MVNAVGYSPLNQYELAAGAGRKTGQTISQSQSPRVQLPATEAKGGDAISLSATAIAALGGSTPLPSTYARFIPVREGFSNAAVAGTIDNPRLETTSAGKTLAETAQTARQLLDEKYDRMKQSGKPFDYNSPQGVDWNSLVGDLDRRTLYAIKSNQVGLFTKEEQTIAENIMYRQEALAMGLYAGPTELAGAFQDRFLGNHAARFKAGIAWFDGLSKDEKSSVAWAYSRATLQQSYESLTRRKDRALDSDEPLARLIYRALDTLTEDGGRRAWTKGRVDSADELLREPWFKGFESNLRELTNHQI